MRDPRKTVILVAIVFLAVACAGSPDPEPRPDRFDDVLDDPGSPIRGVVTAVDGELGIAILSVGEQDDVRAGTSFTAYRDRGYVARLVVERVYPDSCAVRIVPDPARRRLEVGDFVTTAF